MLPLLQVFSVRWSWAIQAMGILRSAGRSGYIPIATCSPHNFDLAKSRGAEEVFDYRAPNLAQTIVCDPPPPLHRSQSTSSLQNRLLTLF